MGLASAKLLIEAPVNGGRNYRIVVVTQINLAICWKLRVSAGTRALLVNTDYAQ